MSAPLRVVAYNFLSGGQPRAGRPLVATPRPLAPDVVLAQECRAPHDAHGERFRVVPGDTLLWAPAATRRWGSAMLLRGLAARPLTIPGFGGWVIGAEVAGRGPAGARSSSSASTARSASAATSGPSTRSWTGSARGAATRTYPGRRFQRGRGPAPASRDDPDVAGEREILARLESEFELVSCWQAANPGRPLAQTLRWSANREAPYHCDGIFVPSTWASRLVACRVVRGSRWAGLSDHNPVLAEFSG
jgi:hypothetical protein